MEIPIHYDPMLAKLIVHGESRIDAIEKMKDAIRGFELEGVITTLDFGEFAMKHPKFIEGDFDTHFIEKYFSEQSSKNGSNEEEQIASTFATWLFKKNKEKLKLPSNNNSEWEKRKYSE
jgi:propionyl-CoA carboxylase alpha chain